ncbi:MAG: DUF4230 domain-containing protein [Clostridiales bacterium]|jgi:hypothetical protein|nr:DUF4230 domain-containing protein [Clostridiales bacterium]
MLFKINKNHHVPIIAIAVGLLIITVSYSPTVRDKQVSEIGPDEGQANELAAIKKALDDLNIKYENSEADKETLKNELGITMAELEETKADLKSMELPDLDVIALNEKYEEVGELVTIDYEYEYISKAYDNGEALFLFGSGDLIFWDTNEFLYKITGVMKLGVDISQMKEGLSIDDKGKMISLTIPPAYVISNDQNESDVERYDIQKGWLNSNPVRDEDLLNAFSNLETELTQKVTDNGMLKYAQELAGHQIMDILQPIASISGYTISISYIA